MSRFSRDELLIGAQGVEKLRDSSVAVFGAGGVGGYVIEALARSGVGRLVIIDGDCVEESNINRQIIALSATVGKPKAELESLRVREINPEIETEALKLFFCAENAGTVDFSSFDYVVDAIDTVASKLLVIEKARAAEVPVISAMGAGNRLDPTRIKIAEIEKTSICPLARVMRHELKKRGISGVKAAFSDEESIKVQQDPNGEKTVGSMAFVPAAMGMVMAAEVVKDLLAV